MSFGGAGFTGCGKSIFCHPVHGEPSEARDLLFFWASKKQQIPRAKPALRNDRVRVFPKFVKQVLAEI